MTPCRLIVDPPLEGAWNMALDEALLEDAADHGTATLRFYEWREPTLSLGYFQPFEERHAHAASRGVAVVRRSSGGGALIHDRELTYSVCLPAEHPLSHESTKLYRAVHETLIASLDEWRLAARMFGDSPAQAPASVTLDAASSPSSSPEPFLCFARRTDADVVVTDPNSNAQTRKICGSAQRRRRGAVLQHGGVLLDQSPAAPELPGVVQVGGVAIPAGELISGWQPRIAAVLRLQLSQQALPAKLIEFAQKLYHEKYANRMWTERR